MWPQREATALIRQLQDFVQSWHSCDRMFSQRSKQFFRFPHQVFNRFRQIDQ